MASSKRDKTSTDRSKSSDYYNFYRVYSMDGPVPVNKSFNSADSNLGYFTAKDIGPPHRNLNIRRFLCKLEKLPTTTSTELWNDLYSAEALGDSDLVDLPRREGRKSKALIFKILDPPAVPEPTPDPSPVPLLAPVRVAPTPSPVVRPPSSLCGKTYYIMNAYHPGRCMHFGDQHDIVLGGETEQFVIARAWRKSPNQQWTVEDAGNGQVYLRNGMGKGCSLTNDTGTAFGTRRGRDDKWELQQEGKYFKIGYPGTSHVLEIKVDWAPGASYHIINLEEPNGTTKQLWNFAKSEDDF